MKNRCVMLAAAMLAAGTGQARAQPGPAEQTAPVARPRPTTAPALVSAPDQIYPDAEREAGHHGEVVISGVMGVDGRLRDAVVSVSSRAPVLDQLALERARASLFTPAKDADGVPVEWRAAIPYSYDNYTSHDPGGGLVRYGCLAFTRDMDWWRSVHPGRPFSEHELYRMLLGLGIVGGMAGFDAAAMKKHGRSFERRWEAALGACRARPDRRLADVLQPEGRAIDALSKLR